MEQTWKRPVPLQRRVLMIGFVAVSLGLAIALAWQNAMHGPFLFDDMPSIVQSPNVRRPASFWEAAWAPAGSGANARPLVALSLAANHALGGLNTFGYHLFNVVIHFLCALVLCDLVRRVSNSLFFGYSVALLWSVHPMVTDAVNSVIGRNELLVALFGLIALDAAQAGFERMSLKRNSRGCFCLCIVSALLAALSKEVAFALPLLVILLKRSQHSRITWSSARGFLISLIAATWIPLTLLVAFGERGDSVGLEAETVSSYDYLRTQGAAIMTYVEKTFVPVSLVADYGNWADSSPSLLQDWRAAIEVLVLLISAAIGALRAPSQHVRAAAYAALCGLVWLAPSSSIVPLAGEVVAEHRFYLPAAAVLVVALGVVWQLLSTFTAQRPDVKFKVGSVLLVVVTSAAAISTRNRNETWQSALTFWEDVVDKKKTNLRARNSYAVALAANGRGAEAEKEYRSILNLNSEHTKAQNNLANLIASRKPEEAERLFRDALDREPDNVEVLTNLGNLLSQHGRVQESFELWDKALRLEPEAAATLLNRGEARIATGRAREGIADLEEALRLEPNFAAARARLAWHLAVSPEAELRNPERSLQLTKGPHRGPRILDARAAALAAVGDFEQAASLASQAAAAASKRSLPSLAAEIERRAALYREGRSYVQQR